MKMETLEYMLPMVALKGLAILPGMGSSLDLNRAKAIHTVEKAMTTDETIFIVTQKNAFAQNPGIEDLYGYGVVAKIKQVTRISEDKIRVFVEGISKAKLMEMSEKGEALFAKIEVVKNDPPIPPAHICKAMVSNLHGILKDYETTKPEMSSDLIKELLEIDEITELVRRLSVDMPMHYIETQRILELDTLQEKYEKLSKMLIEETMVNNAREELNLMVKKKIDENQREYVMREQYKLLQIELGEAGTGLDVEEYLDFVEKEMKASEEIKLRLKKDIKRYRNLTGNSTEAGVLRTYIETLIELPWDKKSRDRNDIVHAQEVLDADHYGLKKVKERIIEFLAVRSVTKNGETPIICLVGPPGTGKTSIARSVAKALNKKYVRISLGGVRDEAEIRGHRKTYIGAMPGRIIEGLKTAGVSNPLMLLDEIDKISSDYKGDTASALLEVLDPEQNKHFRDHYVEIPTDLSRVLFIATANDLSTISKPLLDRMEIIEIGSYTKNEKLHIAKEHLVEKQMKKNGIKTGQIVFTDEGLNAIIEGHTKEAGVRNLERKIGAVCRKALKEILIAGGKAKPIKIKSSNLETYLGKPKFVIDEVNKLDDIGIVRGLAWTYGGGDTLQIEVNTMSGKGGLKLTGQMGEVMKESAEIALSYVRSLLSDKKYKVEADFFDKNTIHLHIPAGAVPKDGPSAGITMATAIMSAVTGKPVRAEVAMTGEVTLRGKVLPVGGLKEKILAAKSAGIKTIIVPEKNRRDIEEFELEITDGVNLIYVSEMPEVIKCALV